MKKMFYKNFPKIPNIENLDIICGEANIKSRSRLDLAIIIFKNFANVAYVTTKSKTFAANIKWLKENKPKIKALISYASPMEGHVGTIYQATNWIYQGLSTDIALMPNWGISLTKDPHDWIHSRSVFNLWGSGNLEHLKKEIGKQGYKQFWRREEPPKHRYIQILPQSKKEKKDLIKRLKHKTKPYPKEASDYNTEIIHHTTYEPDADRDKTFW